MGCHNTKMSDNDLVGDGNGELPEEEDEDDEQEDEDMAEEEDIDETTGQEQQAEQTDQDQAAIAEMPKQYKQYVEDQTNETVEAEYVQPDYAEKTVQVKKLLPKGKEKAGFKVKQKTLKSMVNQYLHPRSKTKKMMKIKAKTITKMKGKSKSLAKTTPRKKESDRSAKDTSAVSIDYASMADDNNKVNKERNKKKSKRQKKSKKSTSKKPSSSKNSSNSRKSKKSTQNSPNKKTRPKSADPVQARKQAQTKEMDKSVISRNKENNAKDKRR